MKKTIFIIVVLFQGSLSFSQQPGIRWQKCFGGTAIDFASFRDSMSASTARVLLQTSDGGYLLGGSTGSANGDVVGFHGGYDIWIVKLDSGRNIMWQRCIGGSGFDEFAKATQTPDRGYIITGETRSTDGDVTDNHGNTDAWVIKLDAAGNIEWKKCYGGTRHDYGMDIALTDDGGYILAGYAGSNDGDVSGNHSDSLDLWLVKLDSIGGIIWQKCYGGTSHDEGYLIKPVPGGYIIGGRTSSINGDVTGGYGFIDYWIVKIDTVGNIIWQKCLGGSSLDEIADIEITFDDGVIISGTTASNNGDVSGFHTPSPGNSVFLRDAWVVKLNSSGGIQWKRCIGGSQTDILNDIQQTPDGNYLLFGSSSSSNGDLTGTRTSPDFWLIKLNPAGATIWQKLYGGSSTDVGTSFLTVGDNEYLVFGQTRSNDGDVSGNHGSADFWFAKLGALSTITGHVYFDRNSNGNKDADEPFMPGVKIRSVGSGYDVISQTSDGRFINDIGIGTFSTSVYNYSPYFVAAPSSRNTTFNSYHLTDSFDFALKPIPGKRDLSISIIPRNPARPGFSVSYLMTYNNSGTDTVASGFVQFKKDSRLSFVSAVPSPDIITGDTLKWNYSALRPFDTASIIINFQIPPPPVISNVDTLTFYANIAPVAGDLTPDNDTATLRQRVTGSFDPNDKTDNLAGKITKEQIADGDYINYHIRFQNTGNDTAFQIVVRDTLDSQLTWGSFQMIDASHTYQVTINSSAITWVFPDIKLVDSLQNEPASHGFISFKIKPETAVIPGDTIKNSASIYFDFNPPVKTNTNETVVWLDDVAICPGGSTIIPAYKTGSTYQWQVDEGSGFVNISNSAVYSGVTNDTLTLNTPPTFWYGYQYRCVIDNLPGFYSPVFKLRFQSMWTGNTDASWENPVNWQCGFLPDEHTDVIIQASVSYAPEINTNTSCRSLLLQPGSTIIIKPSFRLDVRGDN